MKNRKYKYVIIGGGLAGASALESIRSREPGERILLLSDEGVPPYHRPPLSKNLWLGKKKEEEIFIHPPEFYDSESVTLMLNTRALHIDPRNKSVKCSDGNSYSFGKLLLATGGTARPLDLPGLAHERIHSLRTLSDYQNLRKNITVGSTVIVVGGGFIGAELSAVLAQNDIEVQWIFPESFPLSRVIPEALGNELIEMYQEKSVRIVSQDKPILAVPRGARLEITTEKGMSIECDLIAAGIGMIPETRLAEGAGLGTGNGIIVNESLQTSHPDIYAAGDNALYPSHGLKKQIRVEHWDNALQQGKSAGANMSGESSPYLHLPYFFSDMFDFGFEAVGEIDSSLGIYFDFQKENRSGVVYYLRDEKVCGVMLCNLWDKLDEARTLISSGKRYPGNQLKGVI